MLKRKAFGSQSPAPGSRAASAGVKSEGDVKRLKGTPVYGSAPQEQINVKTVVLDLYYDLKERKSMTWADAEIHLQQNYPGVETWTVLNALKTRERVNFIEKTQVFMYEPEVVLRTKQELRRHVRMHSRIDKPLVYKELRELMPGPELAQYMDELEKDGSLMILRSLTGRLKDAPLPPLGRENAWGEKVTGGGPERWKTIFFDTIRENGRATARVEDEMIQTWADVRIADTDNVAKLLEEQDLKASSAVQAPVEKKKEEPKKKKRGRRALKITNTHMKEFGIDFTKDYEAP